MFRPRGNSSFQQPPQQQQQHGASPPSPHHGLGPHGRFGPHGSPQGPGTSPLATAHFASTSPQGAAFQQQQLMAAMYQQQFSQQQFNPQSRQQFKPQQQQQRFQTPPPRRGPYGQHQQSPRGAAWRGETSRGRAGWQQQGSPRMPGFRSPWHGRGADREASVDCYYKKSMVQDPWRGLVPVSVSDMESSRDREASGRHTGRYFGRVTA